MNELHTSESFDKLPLGSKIGRALVFLIGAALAAYGMSQGLPVIAGLIILAVFFILAVERLPSDIDTSDGGQHE